MMRSRVVRRDDNFSPRILILALQREGNRILSDALRPYGVNPAQAEVIELLALHGSLSIKQIGSMLICEGGSPSRLIQTMQSRGMVDVREDMSDRRVRNISLSARATKLVPVVRSIFGELDRMIADRIDGSGGRERTFQKTLYAMLEGGEITDRLRNRTQNYRS